MFDYKKIRDEIENQGFSGPYKIFSNSDLEIIKKKIYKLSKTFFKDEKSIPLSENLTTKNIKKFKPKIQIGFNRRFDKSHSDLVKRYQDGEIGKLEMLIITSRDPAPPSFEYLIKSTIESSSTTIFIVKSFNIGIIIFKIL